MPHETSMSAASRKAWNLKVVQRHDPDILCIWEQVSYVMLMQYSSTGWSKTAVEGSLFLFDRRGDPRYGFFILNRSSSQNYMHLLTAEDNLEVLESYVIFRAKGSKDAPVMGLWASDPEHRAHLGDTLLGLHAHIKSGSTEPYYDPVEVYGAAQGQPALASPPAATTSTTNYAPQQSSTPSRGQSASDSGGMQSLNDLFARLSSSASTNSVAPAPGTSQTSAYPPQPSLPAPVAPNNGSFKPTQAPTQAPPAPSGPLRGQALLDSLFAMASPTRAPASVAQPITNNLPISGLFTMPQAQPTASFSLPPPAAPTNQSQTNTLSPAPSKGGDLLAQLFANINSTQPTPSANNGRSSTPPSAPPTSLPADPAIIHSTKVTPEHKKRINTSVRDRRGYATDTSPRPHHYSHHHRMSVFTEDPTASEDGAGASGSIRNKPRSGRPLVPFQSDTGPVYHPDPTRPHVSNRFPAGENGEEEKVYAAGPGEEEAEDEIFYDGRGNGKGPSPRRQRRRKNGRGAKNGVNLDRGIAADVLMQGIEWDEGVVGKELFLQSIYALLNEQEFVDQLYNDYKVAQTRQSQGS